MGESFDQLGGRTLVVYDGHCGLCNRTVRWLLSRDRHDRLRFAPSESDKVADWLTRNGFGGSRGSGSGSADAPGTILAVRNAGTPVEQVLVRSTAVLALLRELPQPWPAVAALLRLIPRLLRDLGYRFIAKVRYRIWGRLESCPLPAPAERERFL